MLKNKSDSNLKILIFEIMISSHDILNKLSDLKPILYKEYSVKKIGLFGSFSDDSNTEDSDIDLLVEFEKPIGWKFFSLEIYLENIFGVNAVIRNFEIIGEASKKLNDKIKDKYPKVPWKEMYYLRNKISHEFFGVDYEIIWDVATNYLPENKTQIDQIIDKGEIKYGGTTSHIANDLLHCHF